MHGLLEQRHYRTRSLKYFKEKNIIRGPHSGGADPEFALSRLSRSLKPLPYSRMFNSQRRLALLK